MRDLDALRSPEFTREFLTHIGSTPATDHEATDAEIRQLLRDLVRSMPLNALLLEHKDLLRTELGFDDYHEDRIVLTLDGGGIRGLMTLVMLVAIRDLLRKKSGIADLRIDDVFDLAIGTSTGGVIVGCMVVARMELEDISKLYTQFGRVLFSDQNKTDLKQSVAARYGDARMLEILTKLFSNKRLDDPGIAFASSNERGPAGIRFGFTTCDISRSHLRVLLLRNYDGPPELGTQHCYVSESVRATATPPLVIHPYARFYPSLEIHFTDWSMVTQTRYTQWTHEEYFLGLAPSDRRDEYQKRHERDDTLLRDTVLVDGGISVNNPVLLGLAEAERIWCKGQGSNSSNCGIRLVRVGTGVSPDESNPTWNRTVPRPLDTHLFVGPNDRTNYLSVVIDLVTHSYVSSATETETAEATMARFGSMMASYHRLNPQLKRPIRMDDTSDEAIRDLLEQGREWVASDLGRATVEKVAEEIFINSGRLHMLMKQRQKP